MCLLFFISVSVSAVVFLCISLDGYAFILMPQGRRGSTSSLGSATSEAGSSPALSNRPSRNEDEDSLAGFSDFRDPFSRTGGGGQSAPVTSSVDVSLILECFLFLGLHVALRDKRPPLSFTVLKKNRNLLVCNILMDGTPQSLAEFKRIEAAVERDVADSGGQFDNPLQGAEKDRKASV